jgi:hypothetical protein
MMDVLHLVLDTIISLFRTRYGLHAENLALRHQLRYRPRTGFWYRHIQVHRTQLAAGRFNSAAR